MLKSPTRRRMPVLGWPIEALLTAPPPTPPTPIVVPTTGVRVRRRTPLVSRMIVVGVLPPVVPPPPVGDGFKPALAAYLAAQLGPLVAQVSPARDYQTDLYPALIYRVVSRDYSALLAGPAQVRSATVEIQAQDQVYGTVDVLIAQVANLFHAKTNYLMGSLAVMDSYAESDLDEYDDPDDGSDDGTYEDTLILTFHYRTP